MNQQKLVRASGTSNVSMFFSQTTLPEPFVSEPLRYSFAEVFRVHQAGDVFRTRPASYTPISNPVSAIRRGRTATSIDLKSAAPSGIAALVEAVQQVAGVVRAEWSDESEYLKVKTSEGAERIELLLKIDDALRSVVGDAAEQIALILV